MAIRGLVGGLLIGIAAASAIPALLRSDRGDALRRAALRAGGSIADKTRELAEELGEVAEDALAEYKAATEAEEVEPPENRTTSPEGSAGRRSA